MVDLINKRSSEDLPLYEFLKAISETNLPLSLVKNTKRKNLIKSFRESSLQYKKVLNEEPTLHALNSKIKDSKIMRYSPYKGKLR